MSDSPIVPVAAGFIVDSEDRVLLQQRTKPSELQGRWEVPGGKIESGETIEQAVKREIKEETGLDVTVGRLLHAQMNVWQSGPKLVLFYYCTLLNPNIDSSALEFVDFHRLKSYNPLPGILESAWIYFGGWVYSR